jgi:N-methylhydantoinase A
MRYAGQEHTITIQLPSTDGRVTATPAEIRSAFTEEYERTFGHAMEEEVEIVSLRATLRTPLPRRAAEHPAVGVTNGTGERTIRAYSFTNGDWTDFRIVHRSSIGADAPLPGPAIILEETATTYLDAEFEARVDPSGALLVEDTKEA